MSNAPKPVRFLVLTALLFLFFELGEHWFSGKSMGEMSAVIMAAVLLNLAFQWEGIVRMVKQ